MAFIRDLWRAWFASLRHDPQVTFTCHCGAPATGWTYSVMGDGQTIDGAAVCAAHQEEQT